MAPTFLSPSPEPSVKREHPSASSPPSSPAANVTRHPRRSLRVPPPASPGPRPPWDPREESLMRSLKARARCIIRWETIALRINALQLGWTRDQGECRQHWECRGNWESSRVRTPGRTSTQRRAKRAKIRPGVAVAARAPAAAPNTETTTTRSSPAPSLAPARPPPLQVSSRAEIQPPLPPNPQGDATAAYVDAMALETAGGGYADGQDMNSPEWFYNCLVIIQGVGEHIPASSQSTDFRRAAELMARLARGEEEKEHLYLVMRARYRELTGRTLDLEMVRKAVVYVDAVIEEDERIESFRRRELFGFCLGVRQAGLTVEEMEEERSLHVTERLRRREMEVKDGLYRWPLVAACYDELVRQAGN